MKALAALAITLASLLPAPVSADSDYPSRSVRVIVGFPPGETTDLIARVAALELREFFKQNFVVENHAGNYGNVATARVAKAKPDGYTLYLVTPSFASNASVYASATQSPVRDFVAVGRVAIVHELLVVLASMPVKTLADFIAHARANPGRVVFASAGIGSYSHLAAELFKQRAGPLNTLHVPYKGPVPAMVELLGGHVDAHFATMPYAYGHVESGRLKALAVASLKRAAPLPQVPTFAESGLPGFEAVVWNGVVAPAGARYDIVVRLGLGLSKVAGSTAVAQRFAALGAEAVIDTPDRFAEYLRAEVTKWASVAKVSSIKSP